MSDYQRERENQRVDRAERLLDAIKGALQDYATEADRRAALLRFLGAFEEAAEDVIDARERSAG